MGAWREASKRRIEPPLPEEQLVHFKKYKTYPRSIVRRFLTEYLVEKLIWSNKENDRRDGERHYIAAKGVKEFMLLQNKTDYTFNDITSMIDSHAILNFVNDLYITIGIQIREWQS